MNSEKPIYICSLHTGLTWNLHIDSFFSHQIRLWDLRLEIVSQTLPSSSLGAFRFQKKETRIMRMNLRVMSRSHFKSRSCVDSTKSPATCLQQFCSTCQRVP